MTGTVTRLTPRSDGALERSVLLAGVGGLGVLTAARALGEAIHRSGQTVVVGQLHGMSQRGGSVECTVRTGGPRSSMLLGPPDLVVGFERLETLRTLPRLGPRTRVLVSTAAVVPYALATTGESYPDVEEVFEALSGVAADVRVVDAPAIATRAGQGRTLNVVMLGALVGLGVMDLDDEHVLGALDRLCPARFAEVNRRAYELGKAASTGGRRAHG